MSGGDGMEILNVGPGWSMTTKCVGYGRGSRECIECNVSLKREENGSNY